MSIMEHSNWLFICFEQAARGHRLARALCSLPEVYWYSHPDNGKNPWNVYTESTGIQQRKVSRFHYNRYVPGGHLPPPHDFVSKYIPDAKQYYAETFVPLFEKAGGVEILENNLLPYCTHALPHEIFTHFPNAKIINIVHNVDRCVNRYMQVGLNFPGYVKHIGTVPEDNEYVSFLRRLHEIKPDLKVKDVWAQENYGTWWDDQYYDKFKLEKRTFFEFRREARESCFHKNVLSTHNVRDYKLMKDFIRGHIEIDIPDRRSRLEVECRLLGA